MIKYTYHIAFFLVVLVNTLRAQDFQFTQFYEIPLYINPAFAGSEECSRATVVYRNQWVGLTNENYSANFRTMGAFFDHNFESQGIGIGGAVLSDRAGVGTLSSNEVQMMGSYQADVSKHFAIRSGLQLGYVLRNINYNGLRFTDGFESDGNYTDVGDPIQGSPNRGFLDISTGFLAFSEHFWVGFSAHHLNRPNQSFPQIDESRLPIRYSLHGGFKYDLLPNQDPKKYRDVSISPTFMYRSQGKNDQLDAGVYFNYEPFMVGLWYRGLPLIKKNPDSNLSGLPVNHDALAIKLGFDVENMSFGYSYDLTISSLTPNTGGSHEITVTYLFYSAAHPRPGKVPKHHLSLPCPIHYKQRSGAFKLHH